jgi:hypothetical protein
MNTNYYIYKSNKNCTKFYSHSEYESMYNSLSLMVQSHDTIFHPIFPFNAPSTKIVLYEHKRQILRVDAKRFQNWWLASYFHPTVWGESYCKKSLRNPKSNGKSDWWPFELLVSQMHHDCLNIAPCDHTYIRSPPTALVVFSEIKT